MKVLELLSRVGTGKRVCVWFTASCTELFCFLDAEFADIFLGGGAVDCSGGTAAFFVAATTFVSLVILLLWLVFGLYRRFRG